MSERVSVKLADLQPGDIVLDSDGDRWVRTEAGAVFLGETGNIPWTNDQLDDAEEKFGPFTLSEAATTGGV